MYLSVQDKHNSGTSIYFTTSSSRHLPKEWAQQ